MLVLVAFFYPCSDLFSTHITFLPEIRSTFPPQDAQCWQQVNHHIVLIQYGHSNHFTLTTFGNPKSKSMAVLILALLELDVTDSLKILFICKENAGTRSFADLLLWLDPGRYMTYLNFNVILEPVFGSQRVHCFRIL